MVRLLLATQIVCQNCLRKCNCGVKFLPAHGLGQMALEVANLSAQSTWIIHFGLRAESAVCCIRFLTGEFICAKKHAHKMCKMEAGNSCKNESGGAAGPAHTHTHLI